MVTEKVAREVKKYFELNDNENTMVDMYWAEGKQCFEGREKCQHNRTVPLHRSTCHRGKGNNTSRGLCYGISTRKTTEKIIKAENWLFQKRMK